MKKTASVFYTLSVIFSIVGLVLTVITLIASAVGLTVALTDSQSVSSEEELAVIVGASTTLLVYSALALLGSIAGTIFSVVCSKKFKADKMPLWLSIVCILIGALTCTSYGTGVFLLVAGILSTVCISRQGK